MDQTQEASKPNAVTIAVGCVLVVLALYGLVRGFPTTKWTPVPGEVLGSSIQEKYVRHDDSYDYSAYVNYSYEVNGMKYRGSLVQRGLGEQLKNTRYLYALLTWRTYPKGKPVTVYYNPHDPREAVLRTGPDVTTYLILIVGVIIIVLGFRGRGLNIQFRKE